MSTPDGSSKDHLASHYALHVALQTMKERCQHLQTRMTLIEEENRNLRLKSTLDLENPLLPTSDTSENAVLREKIAELTKEKLQLTEQLNSYKMVATENKALWCRLSKLTKESNVDDAYTVDRDGVATTNLIRSKTFTQNAPTFDPKMREKLSSKFESEMEANMSVLDNCDFIKTSNHSYDQISDGLDYLQQEEDEKEEDIKSEVKKCIDTMVALKQACLKQQSDLRTTIGGLKHKKEIEVCKSCQKKSQLSASEVNAKPVTVDKSSATDPVTNDDLEDELLKEITNDIADVTALDDSRGQLQIDLLAAKREADHIDKMCPLCGKVYSSSIQFDTFQEHVESHFIDDSSADLGLERNFEVISHSVGNF